MRKLSIRKAYKISCELKEAVVSASTILSSQTRYEVNNALGQFDAVLSAHHNNQDSELRRQISALSLVCSIRSRIQSANGVPLSYAEDRSINDLIQLQASIKTMLAFYPEDSNVRVTPERDIELNIDRTRSILADTTNLHRSSTNPILPVSGTSQGIKDKLSEERLALRVELESVTGKLAYANITETVELSDDEAQILGSFRIPV